MTDASATFKGSSAYEAPHPTVGGTCKYTLRRTDTADLGVAACPATPACGNGTIDAGEACDVGTLNGHSCATQPGFIGGTLACAPGCTFDTTGCWTTRFVVNGDGTVTDNLWKLQWERKTDDGSVHDKDNLYTWCVGVVSPPSCNDPANPPDGTAFTAFLGTLNNGFSNDGNGGTGNCFAGRCDWRLPTIGELATIHDRTIPGCLHAFPCIDQGVFGPTALEALLVRQHLPRPHATGLGDQFPRPRAFAADQVGGAVRTRGTISAVAPDDATPPSR